MVSIIWVGASARSSILMGSCPWLVKPILIITLVCLPNTFLLIHLLVIHMSIRVALTLFSMSSFREANFYFHLLLLRLFKLRLLRLLCSMVLILARVLFVHLALGHFLLPVHVIFLVREIIILSAGIVYVIAHY